MKKKILYIFLGGILLFFVLLASIPFLIDGNTFKPKIITLLEKNINAKVQLSSMDLSLMGGVRANLHHLTISNPPNVISDKPLCSIETIQLSLNLFKMLLGKPEIDVTLKNPTLFLQQHPEGPWNFSNLRASENTKNDPALRKQAPAHNSKQSIFGFLITRTKVAVELQNGTLHVQDAKGVSNTLSKIHLSTAALHVTSPIRAKLEAECTQCSKQNFLAQGPFEMTISSSPLFEKKPLHLTAAFNLDKLILSHTFFTKDANMPFRLNLSVHQEPSSAFDFELHSQNPLGSLHAKGSFNPKEVMPFQATLELDADFLKTQQLTSLFPLSGAAKIHLTTAGQLKPYLIKSTQGTFTTSNLIVDTEKISPLLKLRQPLKTKNISITGPLVLKFQNQFEWNTLHQFKFTISESTFDFTQTELQIGNAFQKPKNDPLLLHGKGTFERNEAGGTLQLEKTELQWKKLTAHLRGLLQIWPEVSLDLEAETIAFPAEIVRPWTQKLPFELTGNIQVPKLQIQGPLKDFSALTVEGEFLAPKNQIQFNESFFKNQKWKSTGPIDLSLASSFLLKQKKLMSFNVDAKADFSKAALELERAFQKPAGTSFKVEVKTNLKNNKLTLSQGDLIFHNLEAKLNGSLDHFFSKKNRTLDLFLHSSKFTLNSWNTFFPSIQKPFEGEAQVHALKLHWPFSNSKQFSMDSKIELKNVSGEIPPKLIAAKTLTLEGPFKVNLISDISMKSQAIEALNLAAQLDLSRMHLFKENVFSKPADVPFMLTTKIASSRNTAQIETLEVSLDRFKLKGSGKMRSLSQNPHYEFRFSTEPFLFQNLKSYFPKSPQLLEGDLEVDGQIAGKLHDPKEKIYSTFNLKSKELRMVTPVSAEKKGADTALEQDLSSSQKESSPKPSRLFTKATCTIDKLLYKTYAFSNLKALAHYTDRELTLETLNFDLYQGHFNTSALLDFKHSIPRHDIKARLQNFDLAIFLKSQGSKLHEKISGTLLLEADLSLQGTQWPEIQKSLTAKGGFELTNGYFKLFNLTEKLSAIPVLPQIAPSVELSDEFEFLKSSLEVKNEKLTTPNIFLQGKHHLLKASGAIDFTGALHYRGSYYLAKTADFKREIPFSVTGSISKPVPLLDVGRVLQNTVQGVFEEILSPKSKSKEESSEKPKESLPEKVLEELLK
ncbi:MAG: AsmA family protein [Deltaproteobacteria bacterium]|nr:AsmA family protein [Deltaproteobacteria bacterium]